MPDSVQQSTPQPQVASTPQFTNWKKIGLTVLIIIVVTGLIAGAYWFFVLNKNSDDSDLTGPVPKPQITTSTPSATTSAEKDKTVDWKTYTSKELKYEFRHPKDWEAKLTEEKYEGIPVPVIELTSPDYNLDGLGYLISGTIVKFGSTSTKPSNKSLLEYAKQNDSNSFKEISLGANQVVVEELVQSVNNKEVIYLTYYVSDGQKVVLINTHFFSSNGNKFRPLVESIVSTFKFLD